MDKHQVGQKETLVQVRMVTDSLEVTHRPRCSRGCIKGADILAAVMGLLVVALVVGFILYYFLFTPPCKQEVPPVTDTAKVNITGKLKERDNEGGYHIFTVEKAATYFIYGWVRLPEATRQEFSLVQMTDGDERKIVQNNPTDTDTEIFFFSKVKLVDKVKISARFKSDFTDSCFHVYEL